MTPEPRAALIIKLRHIGDALLGTAAASALKAVAPACRVTYLVPRGTEELLSVCPDLDGVLTVARGARAAGGLGPYLRGQWRLLRALRAGRFDLVLDLGGGDRAAFLARVTGAPSRVGVLARRAARNPRRLLYTRTVPPDPRAHIVQQDLDVLRAAGLPVETAPVRIRIPPDLARRAADLARAAGVAGTRPLVAVHPTSRWRFKSWPEERVAACVRRLTDAGLQPALFCGPAPEEAACLTRIAQAAERDVPRFPGSLSLPEAAAVLATAGAFLGVDSALAHLAAAAGTPCVVLFGPTGAYNWGPWVATPARTPYPARAGIQGAGPHLVIQRDWDCVPCGQAGCQGSKRSDCLTAIEVDEVVDAVLARVRRGAEASDRAGR
jgi:heptosyltransferase-3